jgi:glycosyltransferase involved in cell wall biosynthesis
VTYAANDARRPLFTVFTATYNRAHTLGRPYESLLQQTCRDFEWIVVDDGSTDGTSELVERWQAEAWFPIRRIQQTNQGKHIASNRAAIEASGALFVTLDSDDACLPHALERLKVHWEAIPAGERERFSAVAGLCQDQHGRLVGTPFPRDVLDADNLEIRYRYKVKGDKWGFQRTDVMRAFPYPAFAEKGVVAPSLAWNAIGSRYLTRWINEPLLIYWLDYGPPGSQTTRSGPTREGARVRLLEHQSLLNEHVRWSRYAPVEFLRAAAHYARLSLHAGFGLGRQAGALDNAPARALWLLGLPIGYLLYRRDRWRYRPRPAAEARRS